jgi:hypothetical protein
VQVEETELAGSIQPEAVVPRQEFEPAEEPDELPAELGLPAPS